MGQESDGHGSEPGSRRDPDIRPEPHPLFRDVPEDALAALQEAAREVHVAGGDLLVEQGTEADALYFVESGRFRVVVNKKHVVAHIEAGEAIGELAFFAGGTRTADVVATRDSFALCVSRADFDAIAARYPALLSAMLKLVSERLVAATGRMSSAGARSPRVVALVPAGDSALPDDFLSRLHEAVEAVVDRDTPVVALSEATSEAAGDTGYREWLAGEEARGAYILLDASGSEEWGHRVCRNADALLMVARTGKGGARRTDPNPLEQAAMEWITPAERMLLCVRAKVGEEIVGTRSWIAPRTPELHNHVALDRDADFAKVARFLVGKAVGLVLAGGGALGCAHLGIVQALRDADVPIDFIGGASAGAAMGGAIARGMTVDETLDQMEAMFIDAKAMKRLTLPLYSLLDPTVFDRELRNRYGTKDIADQPINFFGVSTNLSTNGLHIHRSGPLWEAVRASGSLPTILPPFIDDEANILVDGGVLDNVPVKVMHGLKTGPNIVVALGDPNEVWRTPARYDKVKGRWMLVRDMMMRRRDDAAFPSIVEVMSRSMVVASRMASKEMLSEHDILVNPPIIEGMQILDWHLGRELAAMASDYVRDNVVESAGLREL